MQRSKIGLFGGALILGLALAPICASAQQKTLKEQLTGTWTLVSANAVEANGNKVPLVQGADVKGLQFFTDSGRLSVQVIGDHPKVASNDRLKMTPEEIKATAESVLSFFGTYTVNEADKSLTFLIERSTYTNQSGEPSKRNVTFAGDEMTLTNPARLGGGQVIFVWRRAK